MRCKFCGSADIEIEGDFLFMPISGTFRSVELLTDVVSVHCLDCDKEWDLCEDEVADVVDELKGARVYV